MPHPCLGGSENLASALRSIRPPSRCFWGSHCEHSCRTDRRLTVGMATIQFVTWDGGGNLPPALGIARELDDSGHTVRIIGEESQRSVVGSAGLSYSSWSRPLSDGLAEHSAADRLSFLIEEVWLNTDLADEVVATLTLHPADVVVVDCMLEGVLARSEGDRGTDCCTRAWTISVRAPGTRLIGRIR